MINLYNVTKYYNLKNGKRHYVFQDINCSIPFENVAIISPNGSGKSTLLRLLGQTDFPSSGSIKTDKTISWPVGLADGFQVSLSAKENIKFVCRIYGMPNTKIKETLDFVYDFAEIGNYFYMPIKSYSSGMKSRVSFGLSMAFDFDYYLIDEVLSVGDQAFREKSARVFKEKRETNDSKIILVSHSMGSIVETCDSAIWIKDGKFLYYPVAKEAVDEYTKYIREKNKPK